jgi:peroxiredoxin
MRFFPILSVALLCAACDRSPPPEPTPTQPARSIPPAAEESPTPTPPAEPIPGPEAKVGDPAPAFTLTDLAGKSHGLEQHRGTTVVLEWFNPGCPFVDYAHRSGPLEVMAATLTGEGIVWLAINSGAPGKQGHGVDANQKAAADFGMEHPILLDEDGTVGRRYGAEKTPHIYLIDDKGVLRYMGAIDNAPMGEVDGEGEKVNYLAAALEDLKSGKPVRTPETKPYGCTVKYAKG